ncbi:MAG: hypothetical protein KF699_02570 [Phycisphaeraceae bacterium]|nr:hypothetical protein [Phycisphaeraceae bacterium]
MMSRPALIEIAVDRVDDALAAIDAGADRLELCSALDHHGLTPARDLVRAAAGRVGTVAMARPAPGSVHDRASWSRTLDDARAVIDAGAGGVVFGCLTAVGRVDAGRVMEMVALCRAAGAEAVFHRAIDLAADPPGALRELADFGVARVLTSGHSGPRTARDLGEIEAAWPMSPAWHAGGDEMPRRIERLRAMVDAACAKPGEIAVLVGGGVRAENARMILEQSGCGELHSSARAGVPPVFSAASVRALVAAVR